MGEEGQDRAQLAGQIEIVGIRGGGSIVMEFRKDASYFFRNPQSGPGEGGRGFEDRANQ